MTDYLKTSDMVKHLCINHKYIFKADICDAIRRRHGGPGYEWSVEDADELMAIRRAVGVNLRSAAKVMLAKRRGDI